MVRLVTLGIASHFGQLKEKILLCSNIPIETLTDPHPPTTIRYRQSSDMACVDRLRMCGTAAKFVTRNSTGWRQLIHVYTRFKQTESFSLSASLSHSN
jgi:hypothetical protein